ncbi:hypothetical protein SteCoe_28076 [Stentor coeruleus]|uniref:Uncharacterized protein n=1 Tax=Stentor coeruleus TaxID=5963 RepID=A0A1R2B993_9CILI|nr:hypothetical protein SteCoe_28076 [Stentor coeruleus]
MGNKQSIVDPEIRALTHLVSSFIQKRSSLNYQINQLKLAQNTKKTCIETKKLRDLKRKNANLVAEIRNSEKILEKIKAKKYIKLKDKDLSKYVNHFVVLISRKNTLFIELSSDLSDSQQFSEKQKKYAQERKHYLAHIGEKHRMYKETLEGTSDLMKKFDVLSKEVALYKEKCEDARIKNEQLRERHSRLAARRRLKRRQTLVVPKLPTNAFVLRSKLLLKTEMQKQLNELKADQQLHMEQQEDMKRHFLLYEEERKDFDTLRQLNTDKEFLKSEIYKYRSELELFQNSPMCLTPVLVPLKEIEDSLNTDQDFTSESFVINAD